MLLKVLDGHDLEHFQQLWNMKGREGEALKKAICLTYTLASRVYGLPDSLICKTMNDIPPLKGEASQRRTFQEEWIRISVKRDLGGSDLAVRARTDQRETAYRHAAIDVFEAYRLCMAIRMLVLAGEDPVPPFIDCLSELDRDYVNQIRRLKVGRRGNQSEGDLQLRRLHQNRRRSTFLGEVESIVDGIMLDLNFKAGDLEHPHKIRVPDEARIALSLLLRRFMERETELFILSALTSDDHFDWKSYIKKRQNCLDEERSRHYPETLKAVLGLMTGKYEKEFYELMRRIEI